MAMDLGDAKITVTAKDEATAKMGKIGKSTENMSRQFKMAAVAIAAMGVALATALNKMINSYAEAGDEVAKMAKRTGWGVEALSEMRYVAKIAGTEIKALETAAKKMSKTILDASRGLETYTRAFTELGLSIEDIKRMAPEDAFWEISRSIAAVENPISRAGYALEIFGRAGTDLLPMLDMTEKEINELRQEVHDLNYAFDDESAAAAEAFVDTKERLNTALKGLGATISEELMPHLEGMITKFANIVKSIADYLEQHPTLINALGVLTGVFLVGGALAVGIWTITKLFRGLAIALAIVQALSGPKGWAMLVAGAAAAAAAIAAIYAATGAGEQPIATPTPEAYAITAKYCREHPNDPKCRDLKARGLISMKYGGIVPGSIGEPVPVMAHGGEAFSGVGAKMQTKEVNIHIGNFMGDELSLRDMARRIQEVMREEDRRTAFPSINKGYFHGVSSV